MDLQELAGKFGLRRDPKAQQRRQDCQGENHNPFGAFAPVVNRLRQDPEGRVVVCAHEKGIPLEPSKEAKARLKKEYGHTLRIGGSLLGRQWTSHHKGNTR